MIIPRLKSSKKWTAFPKEYSDQIQTVFKENFEAHLADADLIVEGRIYSEEIVLRVGYLEKGRLTQANFEISMNYSREKKDAVQRIHNCVDAAASMMMEYLENEGQVDFPFTWKEVPFQGQKLFMQFNTENSSLEAEANKLLGLNDETLIREEVSEEEEDALARAEERIETEREEDDVEFETDEDDENPDDKAPRMFSGKSKKKGDLH